MGLFGDVVGVALRENPQTSHGRIGIDQTDVFCISPFLLLMGLVYPVHVSRHSAVPPRLPFSDKVTKLLLSPVDNKTV